MTPSHRVPKSDHFVAFAAAALRAALLLEGKTGMIRGNGDLHRGEAVFYHARIGIDRLKSPSTKSYLCFGASCSSPLCARIPPKPRSSAINCCCAPATSASLSAGIYSYLFLAQRSLLKIQQIVREEMDAIGGAGDAAAGAATRPKCGRNRAAGT